MAAIQGSSNPGAGQQSFSTRIKVSSAYFVPLLFGYRESVDFDVRLRKSLVTSGSARA